MIVFHFELFLGDVLLEFRNVYYVVLHQDEFLGTVVLDGQIGSHFGSFINIFVEL